ncbi:hypothetical protein GDI0394 [Gluconacetobacter diazotrophicus PA1 5]|uniref:Uncharacterized protein n=1 Tax=Gluconacetobacter diazotrophicus (strain ATCC 49037 / DSM 5601 / CCUG 37298 / CIP 103539 / LMG 7603 / PAl5) TaxID=272568 RepID=A9H5I5_GLUDA|nr:hypothetical protein GDI0394 [Gluconacetobacter diazotrophicus PA1 5]
MISPPGLPLRSGIRTSRRKLSCMATGVTFCPASRHTLGHDMMVPMVSILCWTAILARCASS